MKAKPTRTRGEVVLELNRRDETLMAAATAAAMPSPFRMKRILVPIDFSDCSKKALQYAIPLAQEHNAALTLLYVVPPPFAAGEYTGIDYAQLQAEMQVSGDKGLSKLLNEELDGVISAEKLVRVGSPATEIIAAAKNLDADVIVISTHGRTGLKHVLLGSVVEHVVRRAPCPVLVVREREHDFLAQ